MKTVSQVFLSNQITTPRLSSIGSLEVLSRGIRRDIFKEYHLTIVWRLDLGCKVDTGPRWKVTSVIQGGLVGCGLSRWEQMTGGAGRCQLTDFLDFVVGDDPA